jgi:surface protein
MSQKFDFDFDESSSSSDDDSDSDESDDELEYKSTFTMPERITDENIRELIIKWCQISPFTSYSRDGPVKKNSILTIEEWDVSEVTDMSNLFNFKYKEYAEPNNPDLLKSFISDLGSFNRDISNWDVSNVINMSDMFKNVHYFNQPIGKWNVSNVTNMSGMFDSDNERLTLIKKTPEGFNNPIGEWNVSRVTNMANMFRNASNFNQDIGKWDVSNVTNMSGMFCVAKKFDKPLNSWNVGNVTDMSNMFRNASSFNQPLHDWNVLQVNDMSNMFNGALLFDQPINNWQIKEEYPDMYLNCKISKKNKAHSSAFVEPSYRLLMGENGNIVKDEKGRDISITGLPDDSLKNVFAVTNTSSESLMQDKVETQNVPPKNTSSGMFSLSRFWSSNPKTQPPNSNVGGRRRTRRTRKTNRRKTSKKRTRKIRKINKRR